MNRHARNCLRALIGAALLAALLAALFAAPASAATVAVHVPGTASPYLAGFPDGAKCCSGDLAPQQSPVLVTGLPLAGGTVLTFGVSGSVSYLLDQPPVDTPDGSFFFETAGAPGTPSGKGISGINAPVNALVGVFLDDKLPNTSEPPPGLDFSAGGLGTAFPTLCPSLKQVFFIGDGLTGTGTGAPQQFIVPFGATRLYLGTVDGLGWSTNSGAFDVQVTTSAAGPGGPLVASVLPAGRSIQVGGTATAFATIVNTGPSVAVNCRVAPGPVLPGTFSYQTTNPATNALVGSPNAPAACLLPGAAQSLVFAFKATAPFGPTDVTLAFSCDNTALAPVISGLSTIMLSASATPTADVIALAATPTNNGIVDIPGDTGTGAFAVATSNIGALSSITVTADTGGAALPIDLTLCFTNPSTGVCLNPPAAFFTGNIGTGATPTFAIFAAGHGFVPFNPAVNRIFVRFKDGTGATRGATSVAVRTN